MIAKLKSKLNQPGPSKYLVSLIVPAVFLILVLFFYPDRVQFQADTDEGVELMKAMLVDQGFSLHEDIWSDHPPMLTYLLVAGFRLVGYKVGFSRYIILLLSLLLIWAAGNILSIIWGRKASLVGQALILLLPEYLYLSLATMNGLVSVAFGVLSLWALMEWHQRRKYPWILISALLLSFSVLTKVFLGYLGVVFCIGLLLAEILREKQKFRLSMLLPPVVFGLVFSLILGSAVYFVIGLDNITQLWDMVNAASDIESFQLTSINYYVLHSWPWVILAGIGVFEAVKQKKWMALYQLAWAVIAYLLLLNHAPVWFHHQLYITVPLALLSARPVTGAFEKFWKMLTVDFSPDLSSVVKIIAVFATLAVILPYKLPEPVTLLSPVPDLRPEADMDEREVMVLAHMALYKDQTKWVVTDMPMFAFRSRLPGPPEMAVFSRKRLLTGEITEADVIRVIEEYQPEQVLLWRFYLPEVDEFLMDSYKPIYEIGDKKLWIRNDIETIPLN